MKKAPQSFKDEALKQLMAEPKDWEWWKNSVTNAAQNDVIREHAGAKPATKDILDQERLIKGTMESWKLSKMNPRKEPSGLGDLIDQGLKLDPKNPFFQAARNEIRYAKGRRKETGVDTDQPNKKSKQEELMRKPNPYSKGRPKVG